MKRVRSIFVSLAVLSFSVMLVGCGGGSSEHGMAACGPVTCSAVTAFNPTTCKCEPVDMASVMDLTSSSSD